MGKSALECIPYDDNSIMVGIQGGLFLKVVSAFFITFEPVLEKMILL